MTSAQKAGKERWWGGGEKGAGFSRTRPHDVGRGLRGWGMFGTPPLGIPPDLGPPKLPRGERGGGIPLWGCPSPDDVTSGLGRPSLHLSPAPKANQPPGPLQWGRGWPKRGSAPFFVGDWTPRLLLVYSTQDGAAPRLLQRYSGVTPASGTGGSSPTLGYSGVTLSLPKGYSKVTPGSLGLHQGYSVVTLGTRGLLCGYSRVTPGLLWILHSYSAVTLRFF